jgi:hypothetical protein
MLSDQQPLFAAAKHCPFEVPDISRCHGALVPLALEENREGHERHPVDADPVDPAVPALACHGDVDEARLAQDALRQPFEALGSGL